MTTQAQQALAHFVSVSPCIDAKDYNDDTFNGVMVDGPALWAETETLFTDAEWDHVNNQIVFSDGSAIQYIREGSLYDVTYKAVQA